MAWRRGRSYSQDLRDRVLVVDDLSARQVAERFAVNVSYVIKARQRRQRTGMVTNDQGTGLSPPATGGRTGERDPAAGRVAIIATLAELRAWLLLWHGVGMSSGTMWKTLHELGVTLKNVWPAQSASGFVDLP